MEKKTNILGWAATVLLVSLFLLFAGACGKKTDDAKKHFDLGIQYLEVQKLEEALQELKQAIQIDSNFTDAHFRLGGLYHALKAYTSAIKEYEEVLRIDPHYPRIHTALGNLYYERALKAWAKAVKEDRLTYWEPDTLRQLPFKNRDELVKLIEGYLNILRADTLDAETFSKLGQGYFLLAVEEYQTAIQANSLDTMAQLYLGLTYSEQGYPAKAMAQYEILKKIDTNSGDLLLSVLRQKEKEKKVIEELKKRK